MNFSEKALSKAIESINGELAWKKDDIKLVLEEIMSAGHTVLGGEVWAVVNETNLSPVTKIVDGRIAVGLIPGRNGETGVYSWDTCERKKIWESQNRYKRKVINASLKAIECLKVESSVSPEFQNSIYYNLVWD